MRILADTKVGKIDHYYDKIGVAVVEVLAALKVGDRVKIGKDESAFEQEIDSMQVEHEQVQNAKKGQSVGLKVDQPVKKGDEVFKVK